MPISCAALTAACSQAVDLANSRGGHWQLTVVRDGHVILNEHSADDEGSDGLFWSWSVSKALLSVLTWQLIEQGVLNLDDHLIDWWPKFADGDDRKKQITIQHVLAHRSGLPSGIGGLAADGLTMHDWQKTIRRLELARLRHPVGERAAYHTLSYGFLLGEVIRRATGMELPELYQQRIFTPAGMAESYLGLPKAQLDRAVSMQIGKGLGKVPQAVVNANRVRQAVIPAAGISSTSADLARLFNALARDWRGSKGLQETSPTLLRAGTLRRATTPTNEVSVPDATTHMYTRWSQGFQLGGEPFGHPTRRPFGALASECAFGHNGSNAAVGWHDPVNGLTLGYVSNVMRNPLSDGDLVRDIADVFHQAVAAN